VDATVPDVHLQASSPCIDAGVDVGLPYLGPAPDMGAFEFAASQVCLPLLANSWDSFGISVVRALESLSSSAIRIN
jgi:hypothetical protein